MAMSANPDRPEESRSQQIRPEESRYEEEERLACGRLLSDVWDAWDAGRTADDPHLAACPHCSAALAELTGLGDAVRRTCAEEPGVPEAAAAAVTARVMDLVRLELRPGRPLPLGEPEEDHWIVEAAAARLLRAAVDALPGVRAGSCRIAPLDPADPTGPVHVRVEVAASLDRSLPDLADAVRARIAEVADQDIGIRLGAADVLVVDILDDDDEDDEEEDADGDEYRRHGTGGAA
ncbi:hypothetical protein [Streptomyces cyaneofuscatus]|uniref:Asp23/Gls24 family envelope stress response protein n=1 Tax=Streptomyces cyaneofuscatus TaxID=66883 RepID=A0ABZ1F7F1_9ACTN|nr:hypothetical protein [Streptomyces cyaneofuscatus]WSB12096.1 hypothetical protein OG849_34910 [Streptomyces cyaneofuscatus]WSD44372.1 hypothetical protein OG857_00490 [Streptomyces cyaneofuscatus]